VTVLTNLSKTILISSDLSELRVAVLEENRAVEAYVERRGEGSLAGNIYKARVDNVLRGMEAAFIEMGLPKNGFLHVDDVVIPGMDLATRRKKKIDELLKPGQEVLVQVVKNPMGSKGARVTMELSVAGRFLVLSPDGEGGGVSKRLPDAERERLRKVIKQLDSSDVGVIARTAAEGATLEDLERDLRFLRKLWAQIEMRAREAKSPSLVFREADLSLRVIRDLLSRNVDEVLVDNERQFRRILGFVRTTQPELAERIKHYTNTRPLFEKYGVEAAIRSTLNRRVDLPSGGYLIFDYAEAFTVIDVNTGRFVGKTGRLEDTITKNNIEAAREVMRQLRLRDIGGIIVIDFVDMEKAKNRAEVLSVLQAELAKDRTKTYLVEISPLGLVEMTRQNVTQGVRELLTSTCPTCGGEGRVLSVDTMAVEAERKLRKLVHGSAAEAFQIKLNAKVAARLVGPGGARLVELERETGRSFALDADARLPLEELDVVAEGSRSQIDGTTPVKAGEEMALKISEPHQYNLSDGVARIDGYPVVVGGAIGYVGQEHKVRIDRAGRNVAYATLMDAAPKTMESLYEPAEFEIPELEREVGERLELDDRGRGRRRTPRKSVEKAVEKLEEQIAKEEAGEIVPVVSENGDIETDESAESAEGAAKPRRRRGTRGGRGRKKPETATADAAATDGEVVTDEAAAEAEGEAGEEAPKPRPRRRGTRGGRGRTTKAATDAAAADGEVTEPAAEATADEAPAKPKPARKPRAPRKPRAAAAPKPDEGVAATAAPEPAAPPAPKPATRTAAKAAAEPAPAPAAEPAPEPPAAPAEAAATGKPKKRLISRLLGE